METEVTAFQAIGRPSIVEDIIESFKQALIRGDLHPGQRLPSEAELAQQFGVGRGAVREAMKMLGALGVVTTQQGDGTYIADKPSPSQLNPLVFAVLFETGPLTHLVELRTLIQVGYSQLAAQKATDEDWKRIEEAQKAYEAYATQSERDVERHTELDLAFHYAVLEATHNLLVIKIGRTVEELFYASIRGTLTRAEGWGTGIEGHRRKIQAMRSGDPESIRRVVTESLAYWAKEVQHLND